MAKIFTYRAKGEKIMPVRVTYTKGETNTVKKKMEEYKSKGYGVKFGRPKQGLFGYPPKKLFFAEFKAPRVKKVSVKAYKPRLHPRKGLRGLFD